jgi:beta-glucosidase
LGYESENRFPNGFTWGTATAAHQIEGGNTNNNWWRFEHTEGSGAEESSGDACDSFNRWNEDVDLVQSLGLGTYRFSLEWSRIEPADGEFSIAALDHYARICDALIERNIDPIVTFHHFTLPTWAEDLGGWESDAIVDRYGRFVERAAAHLKGRMARACTINEPNIVAFVGHIMGVFPPGTTLPMQDLGPISDRFIAAHRRGVDAVRSNAPGVPVGLTLSMQEYVAIGGGEERMQRERHMSEDIYLDATDGDDFIGVQTYSRHRVGPDGWAGGEEGVEMLSMGYEYWPQALEATLLRAWQYTNGRTPLIVTENGIGTDDDQQRIEYLGAALAGVQRALDAGVDVRGYTCWSLMDNFEWAFGFRQRFGIVAVDRTTFERTPKPSASWLADAARTNSIPPVPPRSNQTTEG